MTGPAPGRLLLGSFAGLPPVLGAGRRRRRADGVGGAGARVAGLRHDRRRPPGGRAVRRRTGAGAVRRARQLAAPRRLADVRVGSPLRRHRRDVRARLGRLRRADRGAGPGHRRGRADGRPAAARVRRVDDLGAGAEGVHHRPGAHHPRRAAAQAVRGAERRRQLLREPLAPRHRARRHQRHQPDRRSAEPSLLLLGLRRWAPKVPGSLVVVALAVVVASVFHLGDHGLELVGTIDAGLPPSPSPTSGCTAASTWSGPRPV